MFSKRTKVLNIYPSMDAAQSIFISNQVSIMPSRPKGPGRLKLVLIGNQHVGKTSLLNRYIMDMYNPNYTHTRGGEIFRKEMTVDGRRILLTLLDTAGQADVKTLIQSIYRDANGIMVVFDVTNEQSFNMVDDWIDRIETTTEPRPQLVLVGNKDDLQRHRKIEVDRANQRAVESEAEYYDVSAKTGYNVREAFEGLITNTWRRLQPRDSDRSKIRLEEAQSDRSDGCCS